MQESPYVEYHDEVYRVAGTRVALDSIVRRFWEAMHLNRSCSPFRPHGNRASLWRYCLISPSSGVHRRIWRSRPRLKRRRLLSSSVAEPRAARRLVRLKNGVCRPMSAKFTDATRLVILAAAKRREPGLDFQTAQDTGLAGLEDEAPTCLPLQRKRDASY